MNEGRMRKEKNLELEWKKSLPEFMPADTV